jgi:hypothetical protein
LGERDDALVKPLEEATWDKSRVFMVVRVYEVGARVSYITKLQ